jgi:CRP-like cAMP-binding protein
MLTRLADRLLASAGETIMEAGAPGHEFIVLEQGTAEVVRDGERVGVIRAWDFFGELAVLEDGSARSATVIARSHVSALVFTAHFMHEMCERLPLLGGRIERAAAGHRERDGAASGA